MKQNADARGSFDPELLAAYLDGELEGRDELAPLRQRVEAWLAECPQARTQLAEQRRLAKMWRITSPPDPGHGQWRRLAEGVYGRWQESAKTQGVWTRTRWVLAGAVAAAVAGFLILASQRPWDQVRRHTAGDVETNAAATGLEVLAVAQAHEVEILNVEGADTGTVVVGELPVKGPLELATREEISVTHMQPCQRDNMVPRVRGQHPMIWAYLDSERDGE